MSGIFVTTLALEEMNSLNKKGKSNKAGNRITNKIKVRKNEINMKLSSQRVGAVQGISQLTFVINLIFQDCKVLPNTTDLHASILFYILPVQDSRYFVILRYQKSSVFDIPPRYQSTVLAKEYISVIFKLATESPFNSVSTRIIC